MSAAPSGHAQPADAAASISLSNPLSVIFRWPVSRPPWHPCSPCRSVRPGRRLIVYDCLRKCSSRHRGGPPYLVLSSAAFAARAIQLGPWLVAQWSPSARSFARNRNKHGESPHHGEAVDGLHRSRFAPSSVSQIVNSPDRFPRPGNRLCVTLRDRRNSLILKDGAMSDG